MQDTCIVCRKEGEVRGIITVKTFLDCLVSHESDTLLTCEICTEKLLEAIKEAIQKIEVTENIIS